MSFKIERKYFKPSTFSLIKQKLVIIFQNLSNKNFYIPSNDEIKYNSFKNHIYF